MISNKYCCRFLSRWERWCLFDGVSWGWGHAITLIAILPPFGQGIVFFCYIRCDAAVFTTKQSYDWVFENDTAFGSKTFLGELGLSFFCCCRLVWGLLELRSSSIQPQRSISKFRRPVGRNYNGAHQGYWYGKSRCGCWSTSMEDHVTMSKFIAFWVQSLHLQTEPYEKKYRLLLVMWLGHIA